MMDPSPSPFTTGRHFTALVFITVLLLLVVVVFSISVILSFSIIRCAFWEYTSALQIIVDVPYFDKKPEIGTKKLIIIVVTKQRTREERVSVSVQILSGSKTKKLNNNKKEVQPKKIKKERQKSQ